MTHRLRVARNLVGVAFLVPLLVGIDLCGGSTECPNPNACAEDNDSKKAECEHQCKCLANPNPCNGDECKYVEIGDGCKYGGGGCPIHGTGACYTSSSVPQFDNDVAEDVAWWP